MKITPKFAAWFHGIQVFFWLAMIPVALMTSLKESVPFLVLISILALVFSEAAGWQAAMGERRQDQSDDYGSD